MNFKTSRNSLSKLWIFDSLCQFREMYLITTMVMTLSFSTETVGTINVSIPINQLHFMTFKTKFIFINISPIFYVSEEAKGRGTVDFEKEGGGERFQFLLHLNHIQCLNYTIIIRIKYSSNFEVQKWQFY